MNRTTDEDDLKMKLSRNFLFSAVKQYEVYKNNIRTRKLYSRWETKAGKQEYRITDMM